ncbi:LAME_0H10748g1_1 [Lachancea meyersii CBS 8951]|uniref:LAME_0H10748g1_1 n=1 Tax=Lachancea meyersii CBS 8951 TaxID=1266667 RepID=A0A1G4KFW7_9SACH|nr:LAME_0H10748g1_1 [Lachancea meyersii CBS 8951]
MTVVSNLRSRQSNGGKNTVPTSSNEPRLEPEVSDAPQVLFMDTHDLRNRAGHVSPSYYQVATPKSPHELSLMDEAEETHTGPSHHHEHSESEESERLKYETAKREILENLNLHIMLNNNDHTDLVSELGRVEAQMRVLEHMHRDPQLLKHVEQHQEQLYARHREQFLRRKEKEASRASLDGLDPLDSALSGGDGSGGSGGGGHNGFFYHTRSKSAHNLNFAHECGTSAVQAQSRLRPVSNKSEGSRLPDGKGPRTQDHTMASNACSSGSELDPVRSSLLNQHQKRNYSSSCLTSKSGIVGSNEKNEPIFKRPDGILVIIACSFCERSGFTSAQGIVNHVRLKHATSYPSQPLAVLKNQQVLPEDRQTPEIIAQFKDLSLDPQHDYLPHVINIQTSVNPVGHRDRRTGSRELSPRTASPDENQRPNIAKKSTKHLKKLYQSDDFKEIVDYVNESQKDLDCILKQASEAEDLQDSGSDDEVGAKQIVSNNSTANGDDNNPTADAVAPQSRSETPTERKRSGSAAADTSRKRFKAAEKKVRPDAIALMKIPEQDKRSSHYNLRAKSKLRGHNRYE